MTAFPEDPFDTVDPIDLPPVPLAVVRRSGIRLADLRTAFDRAYAALEQAFAQGEAIAAGPALAVYRGDPMAEFDLDIGYPVRDALTTPVTVDGEEILPAELPSGPALARTAIGSYEQLGETWGDLYAAARELGHRPAGISIEVYVSDPRTTDEPDLRTDLILPIQR